MDAAFGEVPPTKNVFWHHARHLFRGPAVNWALLRRRLTCLLMSTFLVWHLVAVVIAPVQESNAVVGPLRLLYSPYLGFFGLDTTWDFFSPVGKGHQFRYVVEDGDGKEHTFVPIKDFYWYLPAHRWFERVYQATMTYPEIYAEFFGKLYCQKHASMHPVAVTLQEIQELDFQPEDHLRGKHPLEPDFVTVNPLIRVVCDNGSESPDQK